MAARVGTRLPGGWELIDTIGVGGMAGIFGAIRPDGQRGAVKLMHDHLLDDAAMRARFALEADVLGRIGAPYVAGVFESGVTLKNEPFFVMELLGGENVGAYRRRAGDRLPFAEVLWVGAGALRALARCHEVGVLHRDVKPSNLFRTTEQDIRLMDFGVALCEWAPEASIGQGVLGTPAYMSPEQAMGTVELDVRADVFSVGATLYRLLSGHRVNSGRTTDETFIIAATTPAASLVTVAPELPMDVIRFVNKSIAWDRRDRFSTAAEMYFELEVLREREQELLEEASQRQARGHMVALGTSGEDPDAAVESPENIALIRLFESLKRLLQTVRAYEWGHKESARVFGVYYEALKAAFKAVGKGVEVTWAVTPTGFEHNGQTVWAPTSPFDDIPFNLFVSGFRHISILPTVSESELIEFTRLLMLDPNSELEIEDDLSTLFLERNLEGIVAVLVNPLENMALLQGIESLTGSLAAVEEELRESLHDLRDGKLMDEAESMSLATASAVEVDEHLFIQARALALNVDDLKVLRGTMRLTRGEWKTRLSTVLADAIRDAASHNDPALVLGPFRELVIRWVSLGRYAAILELYQGLSGSLTGDLRHELAAHYFTDDILRLILEGLGVHPQSADSVAVQGLQTLLDDLGPIGMRTVLHLLPTLEEESLQNLLVEVIALNVAGNGPILGETLARSPMGTALKLLELTRVCEPRDGLLLLAGASQHPNKRIWSAALAERLRLGDHSAAIELIRLLDSPGDDRMHALALVKQYQVAALAPQVADLVQAPSFSQLPIAEMRALLQALGAVRRHDAETTAIQLLQKRGFRAKLQGDGARTVAVEVLAQVGASPQALQALTDVAKERWTKKKSIQRLVDSALEAVSARQGGTDG